LVERLAVDVRAERDCAQYEVFRGVRDPDQVVVLELWANPQALDAHKDLNRSRPSLNAIRELREGDGEREDYVHNRSR
jgi:quinol monooxygenase YgiN